MKKGVLDDFLLDTSKILKAEFERSSNISHRGAKGTARENIIQNFLKKILGDKFIFGTGEIIDSDGNVSKQADIVIYDKNLPILDYGGVQHFLSAGVLAHIEVKSYLSKDELKKAIDISRSVKELKWDIESSMSFGNILTEIPSFIFAYSGVQKKSFKKNINDFFSIPSTQLINDQQLGCAKKEPNMICVLNEYIMVNNSDLSDEGEKHFLNCFLFIETKEKTLRVFFLNLFSRMQKNWIGIPKLGNYCNKPTYTELLEMLF
ncbi:MAG: DUF6602 domain-containing protein [Candidatus Peregrinibacteria bacterium]